MLVPVVLVAVIPHKFDVSCELLHCGVEIVG